MQSLAPFERMPTISAVIPTWNRSKLLASLLADLQAQTRRPEQVIVVDNGSRDDTATVAEGAGAELIRFEENCGFAVAVNAGIRRASGDGILILNNDIVLPPDWVEVLSDAAESDGAAFAAGKLLSKDEPGTIDGTWDLMCRGGHAWRCGFRRKDGAAWSRRRSIHFAPMTAVLFQKSVFSDVGMLDESFEAYYEDVEFGLRCALAGLHGLYAPQAVATHIGKNTLGKHSARVSFLTARNQIYLIAKHYPNSTIRKWFWAILVAQLISLGGAAKSRQLVPALKGVWEGIQKWTNLRGREAESSLLEPILTGCENEIYQLQDELGYDPYWRLYFRLVRSR